MGQRHLCDQNLESGKKPGQDGTLRNRNMLQTRQMGTGGITEWTKWTEWTSPTNKPPVDSSEKGEIEPEWEEKALSGRKTVALPGNDVPL